MRDAAWKQHRRVGWPRVTGVMRAAGLSHDYSGVPSEALAAASARGTRVHEMIADAHANGVPPARFLTAGGSAYRRELPHDVAGCWAAHLRFAEDTRHVPMDSEAVVEHAPWMYFGHLDRRGRVSVRRMRGRVSTTADVVGIFDWKCVRSLDVPAVEIQLAAYRYAWNEMRPRERVAPEDCGAVQLRTDGTYRLHMPSAHEILEAEQVFLAALTLYHARVRMGRIAP